MTDTLSLSDSVLPPKKRMRPSNEAPYALGAPMIMTAKKTKVTISGNTYKGLDPQKNGHWGAQIYGQWETQINHHKRNERTWLGTFKSAVEAAMAYDSASILFGKHNIAKSHRNIPLSDITKHEPEFQKGYTGEDVLDMIRDGSYQHKLEDFVRNRSSENVQKFKQAPEGVKDEESNRCFSCTCKQLFEKELTPSDVGILNRLVIPKKYAVKYLPFLSDEIEKDKEVVFRDRASERQYMFRYCYWRSSQSFVFNRGWNRFVKEKNVKEKDVIVFYTCDEKTLEGQIQNLLMIDVRKFSDNGLVLTNEVDKSVHDSSSNEVMKTGNVFSSKLEDEETKTKENKKSRYAIWC